MDREIAPYLEHDLGELLEREREALRRADIEAVLALSESKLEALRAPLQPEELAQLRAMAVENHDLIAHLLKCLRSALIATVTPDGTLYGPAGETPAEPRPLQRRYG